MAFYLYASPDYNHYSSMAKKSAPAKKIVYREADKGQFVTKKYAETHPKTTVKERVDK